MPVAKTVYVNDNVTLAGRADDERCLEVGGPCSRCRCDHCAAYFGCGGMIVGKAHCEYFCLSGGSHTCAAGAAHNPHKMGSRLVDHPPVVHIVCGSAGGGPDRGRLSVHGLGLAGTLS